jgi:Sulfatase
MTLMSLNMILAEKEGMMRRRSVQEKWWRSVGVFLLALICATAAHADGKKPNILVIFGDDVGQTDISAYSMGVMGFHTPNIDRIAKEGMLFTDYYAENSCTAGRSTFITGQSAWRTGLSKVGVPGAPVGLQARDITIAQALKALGYGTAQFGKNHLGDRDEYLPTNHGFDEFYGNLYHLNAEEEPERPYWPGNNPDFLKSYNPRGVIHSFADGKIQDTGPLTVKRMETIDDETTKSCIDYITKESNAGTPFFAWMNFTRMHIFTHELLALLDNLKIADNTIVVFTTDNGPNAFTWPDAAVTPFRSEKDSNWEGAFRVPAMLRWPGHIKAGSVSNELFSGLDWFPTLLAAAGDTTVKDRLLKGAGFSGRTSKFISMASTSCPISPDNKSMAPARNSSTSMTTATWSRVDLTFCSPVPRSAPLGNLSFANNASPVSSISGPTPSLAFASQECLTSVWTLMSAPRYRAITTTRGASTMPI